MDPDGPEGRVAERPVTVCHGGRRRERALAYLAGGLSRASAAMLLFIVPFRATAFGWSPTVVGLEIGAIFLGPMLVAVPMGRAVDRMGTHRVVLLGSFIGATAVMFCSVATTEWSLAAMLAVGGLGQSALWIAAQTAVGTDGGGSFGWLSAAAQVGNVAGPAIAGLLAVRAGDGSVFLASGGTIGALALVATLLRPGPSALPGTEVQRGHVVQQVAGLLRLPGIRLMLGITVLRVGLVVTRGSYYPLLLHGQGFSKATTGLFVALVALIGVVVAPIVGRLNSEGARRATLLGGMASASVAFTIAPAVSGMGLEVGTAVLLGVGLGISQPALLSQFNRLVPAECRGLAVGLRTSVARVSQLSVPVVLGLLVGTLALPMALVAFGLAGVLASGALGVSRRCSREVGPHDIAPSP